MADPPNDARVNALEIKTARLNAICWLQLVVLCGLCLAMMLQRHVNFIESLEMTHWSNRSKYGRYSACMTPSPLQEKCRSTLNRTESCPRDAC